MIKNQILFTDLHTVSDRKIIPWEDMCLLVMNSLYSSNHKKKKGKRKESMKFVEENMGDAGYWTQYLSSRLMDIHRH